MTKKCPDCNGRGRWQQALLSSNSFSGISSGATELVWYECNTCHGTGVQQDPEEGDDFDIGGSSYADED